MGGVVVVMMMMVMMMIIIIIIILLSLHSPLGPASETIRTAITTISSFSPLLSSPPTPLLRLYHIHIRLKRYPVLEPDMPSVPHPHKHITAAQIMSSSPKTFHMVER